MKRKTGIRAAAFGVVLLMAWAVGHAGEAGQNQPTQALQAEGLLLSRCSVCHSADLITQQRLAPAKWEATIDKMVHWGADVSKEEAALLAGYLAARYHPDAPDEIPAPAVGAEPLRVDAQPVTGHPEGDPGRGEIVFARNCQACHGASAAGGMGPQLAGNPILGDEGRFGDTVRHGRGAMPPWEAVLHPQEIEDIRAWLNRLHD